MKKVLLLGAISPFCDLVKEISELNYLPIICDYYTDAPAKKMGFPSYDVSTTDVEKLIEIAEEYDVDGIMSAFSDRNLLPALNVCEKENKRYFFSKEIIDCLTNKELMKKYFKDVNLPVIKYGVYPVNNIRSSLTEFDFPVVTKPIDAYGSKGIFVCQNEDDILSIIDLVTKESLMNSDKIIIEEFYDADELSVSAWVKEGNAYITCIYDVSRNMGENVVLSGVSFPSKYTERHLPYFSLLLNKTVTAMGIKEGPVTLQCFIGSKGVKVSELLCRLAGGSPYLYPTYYGGPNVAKMMIQYLTGDSIDYQNLCVFSQPEDSSEIFYDIQVMVNKKGNIYYDIDTTTIFRTIPEMVDCRIYYPSGELLINVGNVGVQFAKIICKTTRKHDYYELIERVDNSICVYDDMGNKVSFVIRPNKINVMDCFDIDWSFLTEEY